MQEPQITKYNCLKKSQWTHRDYTIVAVREEDIFMIRDWRNGQMDVLRQSAVLTNEDQKKYFYHTVFPSFKEDNPRQILFSILKNNDCIGYGGLVHIAWQDKRAEVSFLVDTQRANDPETYKADFLAYLELIKQVAFDELGMNRIFTETFDIRAFHISILEASGFREEGRMLQHVLINSKFTDSLIHGYLKAYYVKK